MSTSVKRSAVNGFTLIEDKGGFHKQVFLGNEGNTLLSRHVGEGKTPVEYGEKCMDKRCSKRSLQKGQQIKVYVKYSQEVLTFGVGCHGGVPVEKRKAASKVGSFGLAKPTSGKRERKPAPERKPKYLSAEALVEYLKAEGIFIVA